MVHIRIWAPVFTCMLILASCSPQPTLEVPEEYKKGQKYFHKVCSNCHGSDARGKHTKAPSLIDPDYIESEFTDEDIRQTILNGTNKMPPQRNNVTDEQITEIIKYLRYSQKAANLAVEDEGIEEEDISEDGEELPEKDS